MKFRYSEYSSPDGLKIFRPTVSIIFKHKSKFIHTEAIIDSGADWTILPIEIAEILDVELELLNQTTFHGAGNNPFTVYPSPIKIEHVLRQSGFRPIQWKTTVFFAKSQTGILLGQKGFLERFKVTLDGHRKEVEITL